MSRVILLAPREVECYLGERCYRQLTSLDKFVVSSPPPSVIESEGALGIGKVGEPIDPYLLSELDYSEWWATQTCRPSGGPVKGEVCLFVYFDLLFILLKFF